MVERTPADHRPRGQHFLRNERLAARLVRTSQVAHADLVVELGAGDGRLTAALAAQSGQVLAIENDPRLVRRLRERFATAPNVTVIAIDIEDFRWPDTAFRVVANPPFALTTYLLRQLLCQPALPVSAVDLVVQEGAALKRTRSTGHALNVSWLPWWSLRLDHRIPASAFRPPPRVAAAVLAARRRDPPLLPVEHGRDFALFVERRFRQGIGHDASVQEWIRFYNRARRGNGLRR